MHLNLTEAFTVCKNTVTFEKQGLTSSDPLEI